MIRVRLFGLRKTQRQAGITMSNTALMPRVEVEVAVPEPQPMEELCPEGVTAPEGQSNCVLGKRPRVEPIIEGRGSQGSDDESEIQQRARHVYRGLASFCKRMCSSRAFVERAYFDTPLEVFDDVIKVGMEALGVLVAQRDNIFDALEKTVKSVEEETRERAKLAQAAEAAEARASMAEERAKKAETEALYFKA